MSLYFMESCVPLRTFFLHLACKGILLDPQRVGPLPCLPHLGFNPDPSLPSRSFSPGLSLELSWEPPQCSEWSQVWREGGGGAPVSAEGLDQACGKD